MILYFVHVPRTGGTSIGYWIKNNENFKTIYNAHSTYDKELHDNLKKSEKTIAFTNLRDPVDLAVSLYAYIKIDVNSQNHKDAKTFNFSQWIVKAKRHKNYFTSFFNGNLYCYLTKAPML